MLAKLATPFLRRMHRRALSFDTATSPPARPTPQAGRRYLLYLHVPFCQALCPFCSFHRVTFSQPLARRYFEALRAEIRQYAELGFDVADVYVGGGTPTVDLKELLATLDTIHDVFDAERISVETNPDHLRSDVLGALRGAGVNRLSVGVQSFDDQLLKEMQRYQRYGSGSAIAARLEAARGVMDTLNVDMMFNYPHQTAESLTHDLDILQRCQVDQVSFYPLMAASSVARNMARRMGKLNFRRERGFYYQILEHLTETHQPASVWCFSREPGLVDEYIIDHDEYLGAGSGAFSYLGGVLYATSFSILDYDQQIREHHLGISRARPLSRREQLRFYLLTALFARRLDFDALADAMGATAQDELGFELTALRVLGTLRRDGNGLALTHRGHYHWLVMMREFLNAINNLRDEMRAPNPGEIAASYPELIETYSLR